MKISQIAMFASAALIIACGAANAAGVGNTGARYEVALIQATPQAVASLFRVEVATGAVWQTYGAETQFSQVVDNAPLPAGDYHIYVTASVGPDAKITWTLNRLDAASGRVWTATGGGAAPLVWVAILPPK